MKIEIGSDTYATGKLCAFEQFHVTRRVAPIFGMLGITASQIAKYSDKQTPEADAFAALLPVVFEQVASMREDDVDYVLKTCLSKCSRLQGERFAPVMTQGKLMFMDIEMPVMLQLVLVTMQENLGGFFLMLPAAQPLKAN
jgi:hypothetical protein